MSDYNSSLPVRSEADGTDERVHSKIVGSPTGVSPATNQAAVDDDKNVHVESHGDDPAGTDRVIRTSEEGHTSINGEYDATNNTDPSNIGLIAHTRAASPTDAEQTKRITGVTSGTVHALDVAMHDEDGVPYSSANPLPVSVSTDAEGDEIHNPDQASSIPANNSANHDYTVTALKSFRLKQILACASGKMKIQAQVETGVGTNTFTTFAVRFNSTANPNCDINLNVPKIVAAGVRVRVIKTNLDNQAQDLYSTIVGVEV